MLPRNVAGEWWRVFVLGTRVLSRCRGDVVDHERVILHTVEPPNFVIAKFDGDINEANLSGVDAGTGVKLPTSQWRPGGRPQNLHLRWMRLVPDVPGVLLLEPRKELMEWLRAL